MTIPTPAITTAPAPAHPAVTPAPTPALVGGPTGGDYQAMVRRGFLERTRRHLLCRDIAAVCGHDPHRTALHVYRDKVGEHADEVIPPYDPRIVAEELRPAVANLYRRRTGRTPTAPPFELTFCDRYSFLAAAPDRLVIESHDLGTSTYPLRVTTSTMAAGWGPDGHHTVPIHHLLRLQTQLLVLGLPFAELAVLIGGSDLRIYRVHASETLQQAIVQVGRHFWDTYVRPRIAPSPTYRHPATAELLDKMYLPVDTTTIVLDSSEASELARQYQEASRTVALAEVDKAEAKMRLVRMMGEHQRACLADGTTLTRKVHTVREHTVKERQQVTFRLHKPRGGATADARVGDRVGGGGGGDDTSDNGQEVA
jgi:predicted phage-related endonuclease